MFYILFIVILVFFPFYADAYLDPGVGSMLVQLVLAGVAGIFIFLKISWKKIKWFKKKENEEGDDKKIS